MCAQPKQYIRNWGHFLDKKAEFVMFFPRLVLGIKPWVSYAGQVLYHREPKKKEKEDLLNIKKTNKTKQTQKFQISSKS